MSMKTIFSNLKKDQFNIPNFTKPFSGLEEPVNLLLESTIAVPLTGASLTIAGTICAAIEFIYLPFNTICCKKDALAKGFENFVDSLKVAAVGIGMIAFGPILGLLSLITRTCATIIACHKAPAEAKPEVTASLSLSY